LRTTTKQLVAWQKAIPKHENLHLAVNLSPVQLGDSRLSAIVTNAISASGLLPQRLTVEVTESMLMDDPALAGDQLGALRAGGVKVAIDDFGTGYSSLSLLSTLPVDQVKIDRSFVTGLETDPTSVVLVKAIIDMAAGLGLQTLAEGVESSGQQAILTRLACPLAQGYLIAKPMRAAEFSAFAVLHEPSMTGTHHSDGPAHIRLARSS
jgi:EAL domain-containing protein (putative c-di-GMP-specific phosphodiesterase class I)